MMNRRLFAFVVLITCVLLPWARSDQNAETSQSQDDFPTVTNSPSEADLLPFPAEQAAATMQLPAGFQVTVFAAEPDVQNPIGMAWDDHNRLWIAENYTYSDRRQRFDLSLRDRVLIFEDTDNDGRADRRRVFTDNVQMLTSVEVGRGGVWLMCPPRLLFIPDADGDGTADGPPQVMLDGFEVAQDNYHNFANGLRWGPDGWLYGRCGHSCPGLIGLPGTAEERRVPIDGGIWRFHPERKVFEVLCHGTVNPWGHDWDRHGELFFINTVIGHLWHALPGSHFKESFGESLNPDVYERMDMIADHYHFDKAGKWSDSRDGKANDLGGGHAHIGMMIYQDNRWPQQYRDKLFTLNMHGRRANVERLERTRTGYVGRHEPDFLLSADPFFRGIELSTGPDGNVYVIDWSDTGECHEHTGVHRLSGRIFKVSYGEDRAPQPVVKPACLQGNGPLPQLWKDYQAGNISQEQLRALERHSDEHVRVWAIRLLTDFWPLDWITGPDPKAVYPHDPKTLDMLIRMARKDSSGLVHRVLASTLQRLPVSHRPRVARELAQRDEYAAEHDLSLLTWYGLIPVGDDNPEALVQIVRRSRWPLLTQFATRKLASRIETDPTSLNDVLLVAVGLDESLQRSVLTGMQNAFHGWRKAKAPAAWERFRELPAVAAAPNVVRDLSVLFGDGRAMQQLRDVVQNDAVDLKTRQQALKSLIDAEPDDLRQLCESLLNVRVLNATAAQGLAHFDDPEIARLLARRYRRFHPDDRPSVIEKLVSRPTFARVLLDEIEAGSAALKASDLSAAHARQIRSLGDSQLNTRLRDVWGELRDSSADRLAAITALKQKLPASVLQQADLSAGRALFNRTCAACHQLFGEGKKVGPDLTGSQRTNPDYLLGNILDPSAVVGKDYRMSIVAMEDGRVLNGLVVSQDARTLTLQTATQQVTINVADIEEVQQSSLSAMPEGLLISLNETEIRDLIAYLQSPVQVPLK